MPKNDQIQERLRRDPELAAEVARIQAERVEAAQYTPLIAIRQAAGLSRAELAERLQLTEPAFIELETDQDWTLSTLVRYCDAAGAVAMLTVEIGGNVLDFEARQTARGFLMK
ncbi:helix-turn-helix transcriptional regulator [Mycolicibacterium sp. 141076]|uniref:helix-turn-helix domain-containing protein n=1 Tax=Mycobacteriaceae TaxID=1762 RepID=UPI00299F3247|nr:helix-turn-helix transcriptional regulator [Mycolicibacterium sp. 141076]MDX1879632.1 helix-turn-helix transcriptional regulator [Mycolicibacterium sp. 141076]